MSDLSTQDRNLKNSSKKIFIITKQKRNPADNQKTPEKAQNKQISSPNHKKKGAAYKAPEKITYKDDMKKNSLIDISKDVYNFIVTRRKTTTPECTRFILQKLRGNDKKSVTDKNIQRRVYDAINVMHAIKLIKKNKQELEYVGPEKLNEELGLTEDDFKSNGDKNSPNTNQSVKENSTESLQEELEDLTKKLSELYLKNFFLKMLLKKNEDSPERKNSKEKVKFPFYFVEVNKEDKLKIKQGGDHLKACFLSNGVFYCNGPDEIIRKLVFPLIEEKRRNKQAKTSQKDASKKKFHKEKNRNDADEKSKGYEENSENDLLNLIRDEINENDMDEDDDDLNMDENDLTDFHLQNQHQQQEKSSTQQDDEVFDYLHDKEAFISLLNSNEYLFVPSNSNESSPIPLEEPKKFTQRKSRRDSSDDDSFCG